MFKSKENRYFNIIVQCSLFLFLFIYFTQITPLVPFDADDWSFLGTMRLPFPLWGVFNPSKVLPEVIGPVVGSISAFCVYPITKNYIYSITFTQAVVVSLFITILLYMFYRLLRRTFNMSSTRAICGEVFFFLSFFFLFKHVNSPSYSGFWATDFDCYFHYIIPGILNALIVLIMMEQANFVNNWWKQKYSYKGMFIVLLYFAIFSSPQLSIILASYCIVKLVAITVKWFHSKKNYIAKTYLYFIIIALWLISIIFDLHGRRAASVSATSNGTVIDKLLAVGKAFLLLLKNQNEKIIVLYTLLIILVLVLAFRRMKTQKEESMIFIKQISLMLSSMFITACYLTCAYMKAGAGYMSRIDAMWAVIFFFVISASISFSFLIKEYAGVKLFVPLILVLMALISFNFDYLPIQPNVGQHSAATTRNVDNYIINQIVKADYQGKSKVTVKVPWGEGKVTSKDLSSNWPHAFYMSKWLQNTLYSHGIIRNRIEVIIKPDKKVNKLFYENNKDQQPFTPLETR